MTHQPPKDNGMWCRMPGIYWLLVKADCDQLYITGATTQAPQAQLHDRLSAAEPITVDGHQLDVYTGTSPAPSEVPMFHDRTNRAYLVTADDKVRLAKR